MIGQEVNVAGHAISRWTEHVDPWCPPSAARDLISEFITRGVELDELPGWLTRIVGHRYFTHQDWPQVIAVYKEATHAVLTIRIRQPLPERAG